MKRIKAVLASAALVALGVCGLFTSGDVMAVKCPEGTKHAGSSFPTYAECNLDKTQNDLMGTLETIINVIIAIIGFVAVVMIILGGISMITSQGDTGKVAKGRLTIIYGIVGLVIAILAFAIVNFVLTSVFSS